MVTTGKNVFVNAASTAPLFLLAGRPKTMPRGNRPDPLLQQVIEQCGKAHPGVAYLGSASGDNRDFFRMISVLFKNAGAGEVSLAPTAGAKVDLGKTRDILRNADAVLVSGGDVEEGMRVLGERSLAPLLRARYDHGAVFVGLSAGSIMLCRQWVRWRDASDDSTAEVFPCLGFAPLLCDTHGEAENWEELLALLRVAGQGAVGYGIPSGAGLCVTPNGRPFAMGEPVHRFTMREGAVARITDLELEAKNH
jgi:cyanophycinase-like exopeptidase